MSPSKHLKPETIEDQRLYTRARMVEVACQDCLAHVTAKKNSDAHTSIQWTAEALAACQEFSRMAQSPDGRRITADCPRLRRSIAQAVRDGQLSIGAEDGY